LPPPTWVFLPHGIPGSDHEGRLAISGRRLCLPAFLELRVDNPLASDAKVPHPMRQRWGSPTVEDQRTAPGTAGLHMVAGLPLLRPEEQVFAAMLDGWGSVSNWPATSRSGL
jgi:hypothetical protein